VEENSKVFGNDGENVSCKEAKKSNHHTPQTTYMRKSKAPGPDFH
jgi:hypothetical protein